MTDYYRVEAPTVERDTADLHVTIIHAGADFPGAKNFALKLIWDARAEDQQGEIYRAISADQIVDEEWVVAAAPRFVASVEIVSGGAETLTLDAALEDETGAQPAAIYRVRVTEPKWLTHVQPGMTWTSAAYDASYGEEDDSQDS